MTRKKISFFIVFIFCLIAFTKGFSSEIDSFTGNCESLPDLTEELNKKVNDGIDAAVRLTNRSARRKYLMKNYPFRGRKGIDYCNCQELYLQIRRQFARTLIGQLESYINKLPSDMVLKNTFDRSIYRDFKFEETPTISGTKNMGAIIRVGNNIIGADKFGHFFAEGWSYFIRAYDKGVNIESALFFGRMTESIYYGAITTGVYSYADLVANFNGMRFWNILIGEYSDALNMNEMSRPYIKCKNNKWEMERIFDWDEYIDPGWDERVNYSLFRNEILLEKVKEQIELLKDDEASDCHCVKGQREEIAKLLLEKYGLYEDQLLNLSGHDILPVDLKPAGLLKEISERRMGRNNLRWERNIIYEIKTFLEKRREES